MTDPTPIAPDSAPESSAEAAAKPATDSWEGMLANLRTRFPGQKDSVLFCIHKLQQNAELTLRDFREEASLYGIPMAGRALHSAKVQLGLVEPKERRPKPAPEAIEAPEPGPGRVKRRRRSEPEPEGSIETKVLDAVRQIQSAAGEEADRLRNAVKQAIHILQQALDD